MIQLSRNRIPNRKNRRISSRPEIPILSLLILFNCAPATAGTDPLPANSVAKGKVLAFDIVSQLIKKGTDIAADYYFDFSNASFQTEDHYWSEGRGTRYAGSITETYRRIDFLTATRSTYQAETVIRYADGSVENLPVSRNAFNDWERASRTRRKYRISDGRMVLEETWLMRYDFRIRNTYYKSAKYASKQLTDPLETTIRMDLDGLEGQIVNGRTQNQRSDTHRTTKLSTSKQGISSSQYTLPTNYRLVSCQVDEIYCPGKND